MSRARARWALRLALAAALLAALLWWVDLGALARQLLQADARWLALGLITAVAANGVSALRWRGLAQWLGTQVGLAWAFGIYLHAVAINALLPGAVLGGDLYRTHALVRRGMPTLQAGMAVLLDRLSGLWMLLVLGALAAAWGLAQPVGPGAGAWVIDVAGVSGVALGLPAGAQAAAALALAVVLLALPFVLLALAPRLLRSDFLRRRGATAPTPAVRGAWRDRIAVVLARPDARAQGLRQVLGSALVQILSAGTLACAAAAVGVVLPGWVFMAAAVPIFLLATLPVGFGGWGTREAAAVVALGAFGVAPTQAVAIAVLYGIAATLQGVAGLVLMASRLPRAGAPA